MARSRKRAAALFEAMSKAPQAQIPQRRAVMPWSRKETPEEAAPPLFVAEALTEEEAAAELAAEHADRERTRREQLARSAEAEAAAKARREAKEARKADRRARKEASRLRRAESRSKITPRAVSWKDRAAGFQGKKWLAKRGTVSILGGIAVVCLFLLSAYAWGRRSGGTPGDGTRISGLTDPRTPLDSPLLAGASKNSGKPSVEDASKHNPVIKQLLEPPAAKRRGPSVASNQPLRTENGAVPARTDDKSLNFLLIDSFVVNRYNTADQVRADLDSARRFLAGRGIQTVARKKPNGFLLFCADGVSPSDEAGGQRKRMQQRIEALGDEYRRTGGRYAFKGCYFVSYAAAHEGEAS